MPIVQMNVPLADVLIESAIGFGYMNNRLRSSGVQSTKVEVAIKFVASMQAGFDYESHTHTAGGAFSFWILGGAAAGWYTNTELHLYRHYAEYISMEIKATFEAVPQTTTPP